MRSRAVLAMAVFAVAFSVTGCKKKPVAATTPPAPQVQQNAPPPATTARNEPRQTVSAPARPAEQTPRSFPTKEELEDINRLIARIQDAYFDYDKHTLRPDAEQTLKSDAHTLGDIIKRYPSFKLVVEGHCDERGSDEYNLALGDARAKKAKEYLVNLGLPEAQLNTVSYGKQKPVCTEDNEACWQKNRRAHLEIATLGPGR